MSGNIHLLIREETHDLIIRFEGTPNIQKLCIVQKRLKRTFATLQKRGVIWEFDGLEKLDSALAVVIARHNDSLEKKGVETRVIGMNKDVQNMLEMAKKHTHFDEYPEEKREGIVTRVGRDSVERLNKLNDFFAFFGRTLMAFLQMFYHVKHIRWRETFFEVYESGIKVLPIIILTMFLIGVVVAYQSSAQLKLYGANIFIVDMLGISILRELAPMLAAIIVAGRSGSAYAAQIGVMKITEELDAMRTMGFDPYAFLVLPRIIALMLMMPILIFFADIAGLMGGVLIAKIDLGISPSLFAERFVEVVHVKHFWIGLFKGPFFAVLIASIGIYRGLQVKNDTQSIGFNTTKSVVEAIFAVIICDAFFSIVFTNLGF